jgi:hypothetical protein
MIIFSKDPPLCQFRVASAFCRNESELTQLFCAFSSYASIRLDGASTTSPECEDSRSPDNDGGYLLVRGFRRQTEEPPCPSRYHGSNTEADDRMRIFHSRLYTTLWRYVVCSWKESSLIETQPECVITHPFTDIDNQIAGFCTAFADLRNNFNSRLSLTTTLFMSRTASSVEMMGAYPYTFRYLSCLTIYA